MDHSKFKIHHLFHSNVTNSSWMIADINADHVMVRDMRYKESHLPYRTAEQMLEAIEAANYSKPISLADFEKAIESGAISFEKHEHQNFTIDSMRANTDMNANYAKKKHHGGTR